MPAQGRAKTIAEPASAERVSMVEPKGGRPLLRLFGGLCKSATRRRFCVHVDLQVQPRALGMEPIMELSRRLGARPHETNAL